MVFEEKSFYTVNEFTQAVKALLSGGQLNDVWIKGEISNVTIHNSGHRYFTLKDKKSQLSCVMFKWYGKNLGFELEHGMKVFVLGDIDVYEQRGIYQLKVRSVKPDGTGELYIAFEQLKNRLAMEGLFSPDHKKILPKFPAKIGVATSPTGAVLHDILTVLKRRYPVNVLFMPTIVQGDYAAQSIAGSISALNKTDADLIILGRGGGSLEDLRAFNEEIVARAIFDSRIPIISAVGHETDYTIADFVADVRAPTPSAAAEIAVPEKQDLLNHIARQRERLIENHKNYMNRRTALVSDLGARIEPQMLADRVNHYIQYIDEIYRKQSSCIARLMDIKQTFLKASAGKLDAVSPLGTFSRGYCMVLKMPQNSLVKSIKNVDIHDELSIIVIDGKIICKVNDKKECK